MSVVALNTGSIKIKNIESYGTNEKFNIRSNVVITGNTDITKNLTVLSVVDSNAVNNGGIVAKGGMGVAKNMNIGGNLNVGYNSFYVNSLGPTDTIKIGINTNTPRCTLDINTNDAILVAAGTTNQRPTPAVAGMFRFNNETDLFEGYNGQMWNIIGGVVDTDKDTYITVDATRFDEDVMRFYTNGNQRMAIFDGDTTYGNISDGTVDGSNNKNTTSGMQGGIAIGYGFNKPESTLHIKGNMIVSSNVNIRGDYFKLTTNRNDDKSIKINWWYDCRFSR